MALVPLVEHYWESMIQYTRYTIVFPKYLTYKDFYDDSTTALPINNSDEKISLRVYRRRYRTRSLAPDMMEIVVSFKVPEICQKTTSAVHISLLCKEIAPLPQSKKLRNVSSLEIVMKQYRISDITELLDHGKNLTIQCDLAHSSITLSKSILTSKTEIHAKHFDEAIKRKFLKFFNDKVMCDVEILVDDTEFNAHKIVLASHSPVFEVMFTCDMKEKNENIVRITDAETDIFEAFLNYMYTGSIEMDAEEIAQLLTLADKYQVVDLSNLCNACLSDKLKIKTDYYFEHAISRKEYASFTLDMRNFGINCDAYDNYTSEFLINDRDYSCTLRIVKVGTENLQMRFSTDCKLSLKICVLFGNNSPWTKGESVVLMKHKHISNLDFVLKKYSDWVGLDESLKIICKIVHVDIETIEKPQKKQQVENFSKSLKNSVEKFFNEKQFCDLTVYVGEDEIHVHKVILAQNSSVFKSLFAEEGAEKIEDSMRIDDTDFVTAEAFFRFMYTRSIDKNEKLIRDLLKLTKRYQVINLQVLCQNYVKYYLDTTAIEALIASAVTL